MARNVFFGLAMLAATTFVSGSAFAEEPSLHQVYQAAEAGKMNEAQSMMHEVLQAHPNSGKAHYVEAELLAKQGQVQKAESELATAERLAPGLPFAKPQAVQNLKALLGSTPSARSTEVQHAQMLPPARESSFPWGMLVIGAGLVAFIAWAARFMSQRNGAQAYGGTVVPAGYGGYGPGNAPSSPYGAPMPPYGGGGVGPMGVPGQGLGSRVMSGLATGAAVGAGVVAGEALMHHFMDGKDDSARRVTSDSLPSFRDTSLDDMGGSDFGVSDGSSWDDSSSGDSDWS